ncbi:MAG TPA: ATP-binding cassette domain-containing protein [Patescibacteria group bacterium]|nr:ATP-binding cassette domain-containing protein [Patescibacteria group bacterium]
MAKKMKIKISNMENDNIIEIKNLTKKFKDLTAVDNISFNVKKGEFFAFLGPNGAGKSTTIKILTTLLSPTSGSINVNGYNILEEKNKVRESFGIVFQDQSLDVELTAYENMHFHAVLYRVPKKERKQKIKELLEMVELWDKRNKQVKKYSGGMKRRLEIARGLLHHPNILFLDEPTLGLDPQTRRHIWSYISKLNKRENITIFFSTHYMDEVEKIADKVAIIDNGKIVSQGTVAEILEKQQRANLEEAFISLTGKNIKEESADNLDVIKQYIRKK